MNRWLIGLIALIIVGGCSETSMVQRAIQKSNKKTGCICFLECHVKLKTLKVQDAVLVVWPEKRLFASMLRAIKHHCVNVEVISGQI